MTPRNFYGVILGGGSGTRLWPLSTKNKPKQFLSIGMNKSLIGQTASRLKQVMPKENIWVVCGKNHAEKMPDHIPGISPEHIIIEPQAKNTAPAIALAAMQLRAQDPEAVMVLLPADHLILADFWENFAKDLSFAEQVARDTHALVTFGIKPDHPATGFGYLEEGEVYSLNGKPYSQVRAFHEKPDAKRAKGFLKQGGYFWNSGMFAWEVESFFNELRRCQPDMAQAFEKLSISLGKPEYPANLGKIFEEIENISVDYAVMEKAERVFMVPARFSWDDVGSLTALEQVLRKDSEGNHTEGEVFAIESKGNLAISQTKPIALLGVDDLVVVETPKALLVLPKSKAQDVKKMVEYIKKKGREDLL